MTLKRPFGQAGANVRQNVIALREARRYTYVELSARLAMAGRRIPVLGLQRIEAGDRRVDVDDLVALSEVFGISPSRLLEALPECEICHGAPPEGLACTACGSGLR